MSRYGSRVRQTVKQVHMQRKQTGSLVGLKQLPICRQGRHVKRQNPNTIKRPRKLKEGVNSGSLWEGGSTKQRKLQQV